MRAKISCCQSYNLKNAENLGPAINNILKVIDKYLR